MDQFLADAESILRTASNTLASGHKPEELVILTGVRGQIAVVAGSDWPLASLRLERGANAAYRILCRRNSVIIEGDAHGRSCRLERSMAAQTARHLALGGASGAWMHAGVHQQKLIA